MAPKASRARFAPAKRRAGGSSDAATIDELFYHPAVGEAFDRRRWHGTAGLMDISSSLWVGSYTELFDDEYTHNRARSCGGGYHLPPSTYRARLTGERAAAYAAGAGSKV